MSLASLPAQSVVITSYIGDPAAGHQRNQRTAALLLQPAPLATEKFAQAVSAPLDTSEQLYNLLFQVLPLFPKLVELFLAPAEGLRQPVVGYFLGRQVVAHGQRSPSAGYHRGL